MRLEARRGKYIDMPGSGSDPDTHCCKIAHTTWVNAGQAEPAPFTAFVLSASGKAWVSSGSSFLHSEPKKTGISSIKSLDSDETLSSAFSHLREWVLRDVAVLMSCGNILVFEYAWAYRV